MKNRLDLFTLQLIMITNPRVLNYFFIYLQLIIFMALAAGHSSIRCGPLTMHTQTAIHVAEKIMKVGI